MLPGSGITVESIPLAKVLERWRERRGRYNATGLWPIVVRDAEALDRFRDRWEATREEFEEVEAEGLEPSARTTVPHEPPGRDLPILESVLAGVMPPGGEVRIASFPCLEPAEIPARLLGSGDLCPPPDVHLATLRHWFRSHGAEPLVLGEDSLVLLVRPVCELGEARRVAAEQVAYCGESPEQAEEVAPHLIGLPVWFFWWN